MVQIMCVLCVVLCCARAFGSGSRVHNLRGSLEHCAMLCTRGLSRYTRWLPLGLHMPMLSVLLLTQWSSAGHLSRTDCMI